MVGVPGREVIQDGVKVNRGVDLAHDKLGDPVAQMMECLQHKITVLEPRIEQLKQADQGARAD